MKTTKVKTKNIANTLLKYSKNNNISLDILDFNILSIESYIRTIEKKEYFIFNGNIKEHYNSDEKIINNHLEFMQIFIIEIFKVKQKNLILNYELKYDEFNTDVDIIISKDSTIPYQNMSIKELYILLTKEINKIKAYNKIILNFFDEEAILKLKTFTKFVQAGKFSKSLKLPIFRGIKPNITRKSQLLMHFENQKNEHEFHEVNIGDVLIEYVKPIFGHNGLNAFGNIVDAKTLSNTKDFQKGIDNTSVSIKENTDKKLYISQAKGFANITENGLAVNNQIQRNTLSRVQDKLTKDEDNNIEIFLKEKDATKDSIGEGVELVSETIHVDGFVGSNSILHATNLIIDGATHNTSKQFAKFAKINRHKGKLRCHKADIKLLEGGEIHATTVNIDSCLNGIIYAKDVYIKHVKNKLKVYASNSITIELVSGEDNIFTIDPKVISVLNKKLDFIDIDIENLKFNLEEAHRHYPEKVLHIEKEIEDLKVQKNIIDDSVSNAKIDLIKPLRGLNKIIFVLKNNKKLSYKTDAKKYEQFFLDITENKITLNPVNISIEV